MLSTYDRITRQKTAVLENCIDAVEVEKLNDVSELSFSLPLDDAKNRHCGAFQLVRWDGSQLYRILDGEEDTGDDGAGIIRYSAEHVIATLIDDVIFGTLQKDNLTTRQVIEDILSRQSTRHWELGDCDFTRRFSYSWSNENLLAALFSIPSRFDQEYRWMFDTSAYPWRIHLKLLKQDIEPEYYIRDSRNLLSASRTKKGREVCTRLYALGYGEGVNQLTFASVNGGKPYIDADATATRKYGLITRIWEDLRFEDPQALLERARVLLKGYSQPYESYSVSVADLEKLTGEKYDRAEAGKVVWFEGYKTYITQVERHLQEVGQDALELANAPEDVATSIADLADRQRINSVYANGATNIYAQSFNDNADPTHPAVIQFYVPSEARQINKVMLTWRLERFRAYSVGAESTQTQVRSTSAGGRTTRTSSSTTDTRRTSSSTTDTRRTSSSTDDQSRTSASGGSATLTTDMQPIEIHQDYTTEQIGSGTSHYHEYTYSMDDHAHEIEIPSHRHSFTVPGHDHDVTIPGHSHDVAIPGHNHTVEIPDHQHTVDIPGHTHKTIYGIHEGDRARNVRLLVDGAVVPLAQGQTEIDVADKLSMEQGSGKIRRGTFHTIQLVPDSMTRISATISVQLFIQSEGGGLY